MPKERFKKVRKLQSGGKTKNYKLERFYSSKKEADARAERVRNKFKRQNKFISVRRGRKTSKGYPLYMRRSR